MHFSPGPETLEGQVHRVAEASTATTTCLWGFSILYTWSSHFNGCNNNKGVYGYVMPGRRASWSESVCAMSTIVHPASVSLLPQRPPTTRRSTCRQTPRSASSWPSWTLWTRTSETTRTWPTPPRRISLTLITWRRQGRPLRSAWSPSPVRSWWWRAWHRGTGRYSNSGWWRRTPADLRLHPYVSERLG